MVVTLTEKAISKIKDLYAKDEAVAGKPLRVFVESGGCSGYSYGFKFDEPKPTDTQEDHDGLKLLIDSESQKLLTGSTIDYKEDFGSEGFAINNPNAKKSCGCGNSFEA